MDGGNDDSQTRLSALLTLFFLLNLYVVLALWLNLGVMWFLTPLSTLTGLAFAALHAMRRMGWREAQKLAPGRA